jgi:hypothetical protein
MSANKRVKLWGHWPKQAPKRKPQGVAHVIEPQTVGELGVEQTYDVASGNKIAPLFFHTGLPRQLGHPMRRNEVSNLAQE